MQSMRVGMRLVPSVVASTAMAFVMAGIPTAALAGATLDLGEERALTFGIGTRYSYARVERPKSSGGGHVSDPGLDSARLFFGASLNSRLKVVFNTEWDGAERRIRLLDLNAQYAYSPEVNVWAGRLVSPSDRHNMAGPYYSMGGGYWPCVASRYGCNGGIFRARDNGVVVWGGVADGRLGYSVGAFEGRTFGIGALDDAQARRAGVRSSGGLMYAGRLQYDFWDLETGYFSAANHLGHQDILAIGVAGRYQAHGVLSAGGRGDYGSYNLDFLLEKRIKGAGGFALEAAYYDYDTAGVVKAEQGKAYSAGASYIFEHHIGWGRVQPFARWQQLNADTRIDTDQLDLGVNYVINDYNAQLSATYSRSKVTRSPNLDRFVVALQLQY
jgi:hypothetical protein